MGFVRNVWDYGSQIAANVRTQPQEPEPQPTGTYHGTILNEDGVDTIPDSPPSLLQLSTSAFIKAHGLEHESRESMLQFIDSELQHTQSMSASTAGFSSQHQSSAKSAAAPNAEDVSDQDYRFPGALQPIREAIEPARRLLLYPIGKVPQGKQLRDMAKQYPLNSQQVRTMLEGRHRAKEVFWAEDAVSRHAVITARAAYHEDDFERGRSFALLAQNLPYGHEFQALKNLTLKADKHLMLPDVFNDTLRVLLQATVPDCKKTRVLRKIIATDLPGRYWVTRADRHLDRKKLYHKIKKVKWNSL